jgi:hypothetical protein
MFSSHHVQKVPSLKLHPFVAKRLTCRTGAYPCNIIAPPQTCISFAKTHCNMFLRPSIFALLGVKWRSGARRRLEVAAIKQTLIRQPLHLPVCTPKSTPQFQNTKFLPSRLSPSSFTTLRCAGAQSFRSLAITNSPIDALRHAIVQAITAH